MCCNAMLFHTLLHKPNSVVCWFHAFLSQVGLVSLCPHYLHTTKGYLSSIKFIVFLKRLPAANAGSSATLKGLASGPSASRLRQKRTQGRHHKATTQPQPRARKCQSPFLLALLSLTPQMPLLLVLCLCPVCRHTYTQLRLVCTTTHRCSKRRVIAPSSLGLVSFSNVQDWCMCSSRYNEVLNMTLPCFG